MVLSITDEQAAYAQKVMRLFREAGTLTIRERQESRTLSLMDAVGFLLEKTRAPDFTQRREAQRRLWRDLNRQGEPGRGTATADSASGSSLGRAMRRPGRSTLNEDTKWIS
ncbi:hypothetical protein BHUM_01784 [Candidatus Burkholderia humilis]|nr:hypothetical protein BHUM_01784 [Candidatus Burkholderia humilis]